MTRHESVSALENFHRQTGDLAGLGLLLSFCRSAVAGTEAAVVGWISRNYGQAAQAQSDLSGVLNELTGAVRGVDVHSVIADGYSIFAVALKDLVSHLASTEMLRGELQAKFDAFKAAYGAMIKDAFAPGRMVVLARTGAEFVASLDSAR